LSAAPERRAISFFQGAMTIEIEAARRAPATGAAAFSGPMK
jgi:hypothetical protein